MMRGSNKYDRPIPRDVPCTSRTDFAEEDVDKESHRVQNGVVSQRRRHGELICAEYNYSNSNGLANWVGVGPGVKLDAGA